MDETNAFSTPLSGAKRKARKSDDLFNIAHDNDDVPTCESNPLDNNSIREQENLPGICTPNAKEIKSGKKLKKAERRQVKYQSRVKVISTEDIRRIAAAIHPTTAVTLGAQSPWHQNSDNLISSQVVADNVAYVAHTSRYHQSRIRREHGAGGKKQTPTTPTPGRTVDETASILSRLNVKVCVLAASKERKSIVAKLQDAIRTDLAIADNEARDTMMREAGYFRYVNRRTYNAMIRNNQIWDWVSGRKLEEVDEDDDEDDGEESHSGAVDDGFAVAPERVIDDYGADFVFSGEDVQLQLVERHDAVEDLEVAPCEPDLVANSAVAVARPVSSVVGESKPCVVAGEAAVAPVPAREMAMLGLSSASVRRVLAEYVRDFDRDCERDGDEDGDGGRGGEVER